MWGFLVLFILMVVFGIYGVVAWGTFNRKPTEELPAASGTTVPEATTTSSSVPVTLLDGSAAPPDIENIIDQDGTLIYQFKVPEKWTEEPTESVVPPSVVERGDDDQTLTITMGCAVSEDSLPAILKVTEDPFEVHLTPVVLGPRFGEPCGSEDPAGVAKIVLAEPVGARRLVVARPGTVVPLPGFT